MIRTHLTALRSARGRAALSLGVVLAVGATGTFAHWTDAATLGGTTFTSGTIDVQINNSDTPTSSTLSMSAMVPGNSTAEVFTLKNNGTAPYKWSLTGGLTGTHAANYNSANPNGLILTIRDGGTRGGSGSAFTCSGGTVVYGPTPLTSTTSTSILANQAQIAAAGTKSLCFQIALDASAPTGLQGKTADATFTFTGTSDLS